MPAPGVRLHVAVLLGYVCVAVAFAWPLPLHLGSALLAPVSSDLGVYLWNTWVFRHEIIVNGSFPFLTGEILSLAPPVPLTLHNYTPAANVAALFLQPLIGTPASFNLLTLASGVMAGYTMFLLARHATGDAAAAWIAGLAFGFSPFMSARAMEHFSLVQVAPVPLFVLLFLRFESRPSVATGAAAGAVVAWAFLSDPYYAVYCALIGLLILARGTFDLAVNRAARAPRLRRALTVLLVCVGAVIGLILVRGGGRFEILGFQLSVTQLYNPMLVFVALVIARVLLSVRFRVAWARPLPSLTALLVMALTCLVLLSPVLMAMAIAYRDSELISPGVLWRSSPAGADLLSFLQPNPLHPWFGDDGGRMLAGASVGFVERVASVPWTVILLVAITAVTAPRVFPGFWIVFTGVFAVLALGPFVRVGGLLTYIPTPWAVLRYVPVVGAARMPTRFSVIVMLGAAMLLAYALRERRTRASRPGVLAAIVTAVLLFELLPAPRVLHSARAPSVFHLIAEDPRDVRVLNLPFGLRDGMSSYGDINAAAPYYQTVHQKPILGAYLSRLPLEDVRTYRELPVTSALLALSEGRTVSNADRAAASQNARDMASTLQIGYVVADTSRATTQLIDFAREAFALEYVAADGGFVLYRSPLAVRRNAVPVFIPIDSRMPPGAGQNAMSH